MGRDQDPSGDYGYDLAHEAAVRGKTAEQRPADAERPPVAVPDEGGGDLGYDEAHDF